MTNRTRTLALSLLGAAGLGALALASLPEGEATEPVPFEELREVLADFDTMILAFRLELDQGVLNDPKGFSGLFHVDAVNERIMGRVGGPLLTNKHEYYHLAWDGTTWTIARPGLPPEPLLDGGFFESQAMALLWDEVRSGFPNVSFTEEWPTESGIPMSSGSSPALMQYYRVDLPSVLMPDDFVVYAGNSRREPTRIPVLRGVWRGMRFTVSPRSTYDLDVPLDSWTASYPTTRLKEPSPPPGAPLP